MKNFNLTKILKVGDRVYSTIHGHGTVESIVLKSEFPIRVKFDNDAHHSYTKHGFYLNEEDGECVLFTSRTDRDWGKYMPIAHRYDFEPFEMVLCRNSNNEKWIAGLFSHYSKDIDNQDMFVTVGDCYYYCCIPYADNEHLVGTEKSEYEEDTI